MISLLISPGHFFMLIAQWMNKSIRTTIVVFRESKEEKQNKSVFSSYHLLLHNSRVPDARAASGNHCLLIHSHRLMRASLFPFHSLPDPPDVRQSLGQHDEVSLWRALQGISRAWMTPAQTLLIEKHFQLPKVCFLSHEGPSTPDAFCRKSFNCVLC